MSVKDILSEVKTRNSLVPCVQDLIDCCNYYGGKCKALCDTNFSYRCPFYKNRVDNQEQLKRLRKQREEREDA